MSGCFSGNELYSLEDIGAELNLSHDNPLLYGVYLARNTDLEEEEKNYIKCHMDKLIKKRNKINKINLNYMEQHLKNTK